MKHYIESVIDPYGRYYYSDDVLARLGEGLHCADRLAPAVLAGRTGIDVCPECRAALQARAAVTHARWVEVMRVSYPVDATHANWAWQ